MATEKHPPSLALTMEDILAAARCVAQWSAVGARPLTIARHIREAASRALHFRHATGRVHPLLGDGSVMAAAASLAPTRTAKGQRAVNTLQLLRALGAVSFALTSSDSRLHR